MAYPEVHTLDYSYTSFATGQGDNSFPGAQIDNDLAGLHDSVASMRAFLANSLRSDGVVKPEAIPNTADFAVVLQHYVDDAAEQVTLATAQRTASASSATNSANSAGAAGTSATNAANSASAAATSATAANTAKEAAEAARGQAVAAAGALDPTLVLFKDDNLESLTDKAAARANLELGDLATKNESDLTLGDLAALDSVALANLAAEVANRLVPTGAFQTFLRASAPTGWVEVGTTIGNASSGASRANADTQNLFEALWADLSDANAPMLTSAGGASTRGASAAADWAANKRLSVCDGRGEFIRIMDNGRGVDTGRSLGSLQAELVGAHGHNATTSVSVTVNADGNHAHTVEQAYMPGGSSTPGVEASSTASLTSGATGYAGTHAHTASASASTTVNNNSGAENRPRNIALLACVKL